MLEKQIEIKQPGMPPRSSILDTMFGQVLANQGVLSQ